MLHRSRKGFSPSYRRKRQFGGIWIKRRAKLLSSKQLHQIINMSKIQSAQGKIILVSQSENFTNEIRRLKL